MAVAKDRHISPALLNAKEPPAPKDTPGGSLICQLPVRFNLLTSFPGLAVPYFPSVRLYRFQPQPQLCQQHVCQVSSEKNQEFSILVFTFFTDEATLDSSFTPSIV